MLYKGGTSGAANTGNEPYSEFYASQIAGRMGLTHVDYSLAMWKGNLISVCELFTDINHSYVPIHRFVENYSLRTVAAFIKGLGEDFYNSFVDMLIFDALIFNEDRHFGNFGLIVDSRTNEPCSFAPIFDNIVKEFISGRQRAQLRQMIGFKFKRDKNYNLPAKRLKLIENFLQKRVAELLEM